MSFNWLDQGFNPCESYSRELDRRVAMDEYPYGYVGDAPPPGHVNQGLLDDAYKNEREASQNLPWDYKHKTDNLKVPRSAKEEGSFPDSESKMKYKMGRR